MVHVTPREQATPIDDFRCLRQQNVVVWIRSRDERNAVPPSPQNGNRVRKGKTGRNEDKRGPQRRIIQSKMKHIG